MVSFGKAAFCGMIGFCVAYWQGLSVAMHVLVVLMLIDYITGVMTAYITGFGLSSAVGVKGLLRKAYCIIIVGVCSYAEGFVGVELASDVVTVAFIANEFLSIVENAGKAGVPLPETVTKAVEVLRHEAGD